MSRRKLLINRVCPYCGSVALYTAKRFFCGNCGKRVVDFVIRSKEELIDEDLTSEIDNIIKKRIEAENYCH